MHCIKEAAKAQNSRQAELQTEEDKLAQQREDHNTLEARQEA